MLCSCGLQINLYQNLLSKKHKELLGNMERLVGGLEKLKSTASQVTCEGVKEWPSMGIRDFLMPEIEALH